MSAHRKPLQRQSGHDEWLVLESWRCLHRISEITPDHEEDYINGDGVAVCGATGHFMIPGVMSRMGLRRCAHCCDSLGIPRGVGNTLNARIDEPK